MKDLEQEYKNHQHSLKLESLDLQIELAKIVDDENEYLDLIRKKRNYKIDYLLRKNKVNKEIDYFDDEI
jgi:hypothetical protein